MVETPDFEARTKQFEGVQKGDRLLIDEQDYQFVRLNDPQLPSSVVVQTPEGEERSFDLDTVHVTVQGRVQAALGEGATELSAEGNRILALFSTQYLWEVVQEVKKVQDQLNPSDLEQIRIRLADEWIQNLKRGASFRFLVEECGFLLKDLEPGKKEALVYAVIGYYMSALQRGQLKDLIGMEKVLNFFEFTEFPIELPEKERIEFFLMHLPPDFWTGLSESVYGGKITPQVQTHLKTYHQLGAPKRPQLAQFQDELEARSTQRLEKGDADNVERRHGLVQINSRGYLVPVFDAVTPTDEALRVRGSLISWLVDSGELSRTHGGPLPIRYSRGAERFRERHRDTADKQDQQDIAAQVQMLQPQILNAIRNSDEEELRRLHAQIALINGPHTQPTTIPIFEPGASETGLSMSAPKADPALDAYCMEVARTLIQTYFPNTRITAKDVEFILSMRELVMIQLGKNPALEEISQKELGGIFAPLGLSDPKNILDTGKSTPKMLEYIDSTEETAKKAAEEEKKKDFQERISSAVQQLSAQWDGITGSARRQRVSIYDTGLANPDHSYQANENARHNAKVDRQSGASIDALFKMIEFLRKTQNQHEIWQWMIHELEMALLAGNNKFQSCFKKGGGIDWGQVGILQRSIPYNSHAPDRERQILSALQSIYRCFWI